MKIELYLDGHQVEINNDIDFTLNKTFTELTDLTAIIVDYSKTISIPMTPDNNELFNMVFRLDHQVLMGTEYVDYDPSVRIPMAMFYNGDIVLEGYAVLNKVNLNTRTYEINLYGQLGKIFSELKEKTLVDYSGSNGFFQTFTMNKEAILKSFQNDNPNLYWGSADWSDFFGFAPQLYGNTDILDTKNCELAGGTIMDFVKTMNTTRGFESADYYIGDGLDFNQYGELRSYMARPYVYAGKLVQLVQNEINTGDYDGYTLTLDPDWFNSNNPYYTNLCYFPGRESVIDKGKSVTGFVTWNNSERTLSFPMGFLPSASTEGLEGYTYTTSGYTVTIKDAGSDNLGANISLNCDGITVRDRVTGVGNLSDFDRDGAWAYYNLPNGSGIVPVRYIAIYDGEGQMLYKLILCSENIVAVTEDSGFLSYSWSKQEHSNIWGKMKSRDDRVIAPNSTSWVNKGVDHNYCEVTQTYNFGNVIINTNKFSFRMQCDLVFGSTGNIYKENISSSEYNTLCPFKNNKYKTTEWNRSGSTYSMYFTPVKQMDVTSLTYRSGSTWSIREILGEDFNPFTWLIDYAKKFRLFFDIDYMTRTINLKAGYFNTVDFKEAVVDYSKEVTVEPLLNRYKEINYGYADNESTKGRKYKNRYKVNYGDMTIETGIKINNDKMSLIPDKDESMFIPVKTNALYWDNLNSTAQIVYGHILKTDRIINTLNNEGEVEYYPFYCFRAGNHSISQAFYRITDDTPEQKRTGKYTLIGKTGLSDYTLNMSLIPQFDNFLSRSVEVSSVIAPSVARMAAIEGIDRIEKELAIDRDIILPIEGDLDGTTEEAVNERVDRFTNPVTGEVIDVVVPVYPEEPLEPVHPFEPDLPVLPGSGTGSGTGTTNPTYQTFLYWATFGVPREVYNGNVPSNIESYSVYNRWKNYLNEIFNVNNKKVTCYIRMSYPDYINFKFNQLLVIDGCTFLVNKVIDFNPNSTEPTKVELLQIQDPGNLK